MTPKFKKAIECVITTHERGFQKRVSDPGNWRNGELVGTKWGISAKSFPEVDIPSLTITDSEELYWEVWGQFDSLNDLRVLTKTLDLAVNMQWATHGPATRILQRSVVVCGRTIPIDDIFGRQTAEVANTLNPGLLLQTMCEQALKHYQEIEESRPEMKEWFANWNHRATWVPPESLAL